MLKSSESYATLHGPVQVHFLYHTLNVIVVSRDATNNLLLMVKDLEVSQGRFYFLCMHFVEIVLGNIWGMFLTIASNIDILTTVYSEHGYNGFLFLLSFLSARKEMERSAGGNALSFLWIRIHNKILLWSMYSCISRTCFSRFIFLNVCLFCVDIIINYIKHQ